MGLDVRETVPAVTQTHNALIGSFYLCSEKLCRSVLQHELNKQLLQTNTCGPLRVLINVNVRGQTFYCGGKGPLETGETEDVHSLSNGVQEFKRR